MKFSLIIPAYNSAQYIKQCLESCMYQKGTDLADYEIIVINDGSTDETVSVAKSVAGRFENFSIYSKSNGGLSSARNYGLQKASGEYIWFVDSDDWISNNSINLLNEITSQYSPDMVMFNACDVIQGKEKHPRLTFTRENIEKTGLEVFLSNNWEACAPFSIYSKDFLLKNSLLFYEGIFHEDNEFTPRALISATKIVQTNKTLYFVRQTPGSITRTINPKRANDIMIVADSLDKFIRNEIKKLPEVMRKSAVTRMSRYISMCINSALFQSSKYNKQQQHEFNITLKNNFRLLNHFYKAKTSKYFIEWLFLKLFPSPLAGYQFLRHLINTGA